MESIKRKQKTSDHKIIALQNCQSSCYESEKDKFNSQFDHASSFDYVNYYNYSLKISNFYDNILNESQSNSSYEPKQLSSIPENVNEEQSSSRNNENETGSKIMNSPHQNEEKIIKKSPPNGVISSIIYCENKNGHQETCFTDNKNELNEKKNNVNGSNRLEIDFDINRVTCNQCICSSSLCHIF